MNTKCRAKLLNVQVQLRDLCEEIRKEVRSLRIEGKIEEAIELQDQQSKLESARLIVGEV